MTSCAKCRYFRRTHENAGLCLWVPPQPPRRLPHPPTTGPVVATARVLVTTHYVGSEPTVRDCPVYCAK